MRRSNAAEPDLGRWRALQAWIEGSERRVTVPYAAELAEMVSDAEGRIVASVADYAAVRDLVVDIVAQGVDATVSPIVRETVEAVWL
jgi:hypothetical protein